MSLSKNNHKDKLNAGIKTKKCKYLGIDLYFALQKNIEKLKAGMVIRKKEVSINLSNQIAILIFPIEY